jgi:hypothetical protein
VANGDVDVGRGVAVVAMMGVAMVMLVRVCVCECVYGRVVTADTPKATLMHICCRDSAGCGGKAEANAQNR